MTKSNEAFSRVIIDGQLAAQDWSTQDQNSVRYEYILPDGTRADYVLCDRYGRSMAVIEAKRFSVSPGDAATRAKAYAEQLGVPYIFLANGKEIRFWNGKRKPTENRQNLLQTNRPREAFCHAPSAARSLPCLSTRTLPDAIIKRIVLTRSARR